MLDADINTEEILRKADLHEWEVDEYSYLIKTVHQINAIEEEDFQRRFKKFWGYVSFDKEWHPHVFIAIEKVKAGKLSTFGEVLTFLSSDAVNKSVASKVLSTLNPNYPIWDSRVAAVFNLYEPRGTSLEEKIKDACNTFEWLQHWYDKAFFTGRGERIIKVFDERLPQYSDLSPIKKIDFVLWAYGKQLNDSKSK